MAGERVSGNLTRSGKGTLIYALDGTLSCLAVNQKAEHLAVAGRNLFQVLEIRDDCFVPITRSKAPPRHLASNTPDSPCVCSDGVVPVTSTSSSAQAASTTVHRSQNITDVSWSCANTVLASGSTNGIITLWNVDYNLTQQQCFSGHSRSIHCVTFHPTNPWELVTASQDGKVKLFDTREPNPDSNARTFIQRTALPSPVRDVTYSPRHSFLIAAGLENGTISLWDTRQQGRPYWAFQGHSCCVASLDWHPIWQGTGRNWLATAGVADHLIKVWNFDQTTSGQSGCPSVVYTVRTSNVTRIRWRPGSLTQLVSSCNQTFDLNTYLWDLKRPYLPYAAFEGHKGVVTSIAWNAGEADYFYTAGRDGLLIRHCVADGLRPAESAPPVALCFSPRGQLAHAVSRDRFLANQPAPYVDETNLVTQSPFFPGFRGTNGTLDTSSASSMGQSDGPPGFYAAPSCGKLDWYNSSPINLPPMGSAQSADLFVSQAQSLLFCFEPSLEAFRFVGGMASNTVLLSDLIIALAKHYQFVGPNVDRVCSHNAAVALRFGQAFLVQFWSLLRCVYGSIPTIPPNKPSVAVPDQEHAKTLSDTKAEMVPPNSADPPRPPVPSDTSIRPSGRSDPRAVNSMPCPSPTAPSGVMLRDMLSTIGVVLQCDDPSTPTILSPKRAPSPSDHSICVVYDPNIKQEVSNLHHSEPQLIVDPTGTLERVHEVLGPFKYPHPVVGSKTERLIDQSEPGSTASVSGTIPIDRQRTSSMCRSRRSPTSAQLFPHGLELSASSAQTCDSLGESADFLFHYNNPANKCGGTYPETRSALAPTQTDLTAESETNPHDLNPDLLSTVDVSDDPILLETTFLPDEAFSVRHPIEAHLRKVFGELGNSIGGNGAPVSNPNGPEQSTSDSPIRHQNSQEVQTGMSKSFNKPVTIEAQNDVRRSLDQEFRLLAPFNTSLAAATAAAVNADRTDLRRIARCYSAYCAMVLRAGRVRSCSDRMHSFVGIGSGTSTYQGMDQRCVHRKLVHGLLGIAVSISNVDIVFSHYEAVR
ncbi:unnamed protein product [Dicrocoelium dendriticum]|nr:unnamed protein product [Dicrocoelium dendriticum]